MGNRQAGDAQRHLDGHLVVGSEVGGLAAQSDASPIMLRLVTVTSAPRAVVTDGLERRTWPGFEDVSLL